MRSDTQYKCTAWLLAQQKSLSDLSAAFIPSRLVTAFDLFLCWHFSVWLVVLFTFHHGWDDQRYTLPPKSHLPYTQSACPSLQHQKWSLQCSDLWLKSRGSSYLWHRPHISGPESCNSHPECSYISSTLHNCWHHLLNTCKPDEFMYPHTKSSALSSILKHPTIQTQPCHHSINTCILLHATCCTSDQHNPPSTQKHFLPQHTSIPTPCSTEHLI